jgi:hypothetical protein
VPDHRVLAVTLDSRAAILTDLDDCPDQLAPNLRAVLLNEQVWHARDALG